MLGIFSGGRWVFLSRTGVALEFRQPWSDFRFQLRPKLEYSLSRSSAASLDQDLGSVALKLGARHPLGFRVRGHAADAGLYHEVTYFFDDTVLVAPGRILPVNEQYEVGVSFGTVERVPIRFFSLPRLSGEKFNGDERQWIYHGERSWEHLRRGELNHPYWSENALLFGFASPPVSKYIIAVKREKRAQAPASLAESVQDISGVEIRGSSRSNRLIVEASADGIEEVKKQFGEVCHIERPIEHDVM